MIYTEAKNGFTLSTDKKRLDIACIHRYLSGESYWCKNVPLEIVQKSIEGAVCVGVYDGSEQVGFARVVTDHATFGYLADVFILPAYRGKGLGKWLMQFIMAHPQLQGFRNWMLATKDAHGLYAQFGFKPLENPERYMRYNLFSEYPSTKEQEGK